MDPDLNKYDLNHVVAHHATMSKETWEAAYRQCWEEYYSDAHIERVLRRNAALKNNVRQALFLLGAFKGALEIEHVHPLECGFIRRKYRRDRRPGMKIEPALVFYPKYWLDAVVRQARWVGMFARFTMRYGSIERDPARLAYMDEALTPVDEHEGEREMFSTVEAQTWVVEQTRMAKVRAEAGA
jgi:hypothetical protein